jgi:hypothetical protein
MAAVARSRQVYIGWLEATVLSVHLPEKKRDISICTFNLPCHLGPAQLNLHEPANSNRNAACSQQYPGQLGPERVAREKGWYEKKLSSGV